MTIDNRRPYRARTPSGNDIPIPESVFQALRHVDEKVEGMRAEVAGIDAKVDKMAEAVTRLASRKGADMTKIIVALAATIPAIIGGVRLSTPTPEPARIEVQHTPIDPRMAECSSLQPGTQAQSECFARVQAEIQSGKRSAP